MLKEIIFPLEVSDHLTTVLVFEPKGVEQKLRPASMTIESMNDLVGRASQRVSRYRISVAKPKADCSVQLASCNVDLREGLNCHDLLQNNPNPNQTRK